MIFKNLFKKEKKTDIYLYNTLSRKKELFKSIKKGKVGIYTCGPTVYNYPHLGNMRTYIFEDILKRVLEYNGYDVKHIMNITDVGHLTNDRDMGEDKVEKEAKKEGKTAWQIADFYTKAFKEDLKRLNIISPEVFCKATDNIKEQINLISRLEKKGFTYKTSDGIYFDTSKVEDYTKLSGQRIEYLKEGARVEINEEKKNPTDFALWKFSPKESSREMEWPSPYGVGFPGWHIECSAMSMKYLGDHFDIHCGGVDNINIHHTNEIAQSESATGKKPWVNFWMHGAFLNLEAGKMSKSSGNFVTIENSFTDKGINPLIYRFATFMTHYRKPMEWSDDVLITAKNSFEHLYSKVGNLGKKAGKISEEWKDKFLFAINDDLNMPQAIAILNEMLKSDISPADKLATALDFDKVLGIKLNEAAQKKIEIPSKVKKLVEEREIARKEKNWSKSDELRSEIISMGYEVKDSPNGPEIYKM
jgi:cysteinyl-tRNA synthetase